jgi:hypothetical protein
MSASSSGQAGTRRPTLGAKLRLERRRRRRKKEKKKKKKKKKIAKRAPRDDALVCYAVARRSKCRSDVILRQIVVNGKSAELPICRALNMWGTDLRIRERQKGGRDLKIRSWCSGG